jgi:hypothetical protein
MVPTGPLATLSPESIVASTVRVVLRGKTSFSYHYYSAGVLTTHCSLHCLAAHRSPRVNNFYKQDHGCPHTSSSSH